MWLSEMKTWHDANYFNMWFNFQSIYVEHDLISVGNSGQLGKHVFESLRNLTWTWYHDDLVSIFNRYRYRHTPHPLRHWLYFTNEVERKWNSLNLLHRIIVTCTVILRSQGFLLERMPFWSSSGRSLNPGMSRQKLKNNFPSFLEPRTAFSTILFRPSTSNPVSE